MAGAAVGAAAGAAQAAGGVPAEDQADRQHDIRLLQSLLHGERVLEYAYRRALEVWHFKPATADLLRLMRSHERQHARWLEAEIAALGGSASTGAGGGPFPPPDVAALFQNVNGARTITALISVEALIQADYFHSVGEVKSPELARSVAQILASEAQHSMMLTDVLDHGDLPDILSQAYIRGIGDLSS